MPRRTLTLVSEIAGVVGLLLVALAAVDVIAYARFLRSLLFR